MAEPTRIGANDLPETIQKAGIPTMYGGREYRSRLEARWAAMFGILGWDVEYEPFDCDGWIPDFVIEGAQRMLVEIKPASSAAEFTDAAAKALRADPKLDVLFLGYRIPDYEGWGCLGWLMEHEVYGYSGVDENAMALISTNDDGSMDVCHTYQSFRRRISGVYDSHQHPIEAALLRTMWAEAGNMVKWFPGS